MGEHFWPSIYPAVIVGVLCGLYLGGLANAALGAVGSLAAAFVSLQISPALFTAEGILPLAALLAVSSIGAFGVAGGARAMAGLRRTARR